MDNEQQEKAVPCESDKKLNIVDEKPIGNNVGGSTKKNKNKKKKAAAAAAGVKPNTDISDKNEIVAASGGEPSSSTAATNDSSDTNGEIKNAQKNVIELMEQLKLTQRFLPLLRSAAKSPEEALQKQYKFWSTQPVPKLDEKIEVNEPIEPAKDISEIRAKPYALPDGFKWEALDINDFQVLIELYTLLNENYVEDDDAMFRFDYQPGFLKWALQPPGWRMEWHVGVRVVKSGLLVGFISAIPGHVRIFNKTEKIVEINFLCVHKKLRSKRVAPVLIREITRRVNLTGTFQAVYTAGVVLPKPVATCRYWHRSLNPRKLIDIKFSHLQRNMTMQRTIKLYKLPEETKTPGFRAMIASDVPKAYKLLDTYLLKFNLTPKFDEDEFRHWFTPQEDIIYSYVVEDPATGNITDFISYYMLPSSVMRHALHKKVQAAYSFYNVSSKTPWTELINDALISAKNLGFDVFNALDLMENKQFLEKLKFGIGDGNLNYYLYNWRCPSVNPEDVGLILL